MFRITLNDKLLNTIFFYLMTIKKILFSFSLVLLNLFVKKHHKTVIPYCYNAGKCKG